MTKYEKNYIQCLRHLVVQGSEIRDGLYAVPYLQLEADVADAFPILVMRDLDFRETVSEVTEEIAECESAAAYQFSTNCGGEAAIWSKISGKLHCHVSFNSMDYTNTVPVKVAEYAARMHLLAEKHHTGTGYITVSLVAPVLYMSDWDKISSYLVRVTFCEYTSRLPVNPYYSRLQYVPQVVIDNGTVMLVDVPDSIV